MQTATTAETAAKVQKKSAAITSRSPKLQPNHRNCMKTAGQLQRVQ